MKKDSTEINSKLYLFTLSSDIKKYSGITSPLFNLIKCRDY